MSFSANSSLTNEALFYKSKEKKSDISGLTGPKIELLEHQLFIAGEITKRKYPRVLLADEVGLGKTIEAGLTINKMLWDKRISRVLIVAPEHLNKQWQYEMQEKFNLVFKISEDNDSFPKAKLIICGKNQLRNFHKEIEAAKIDLLIIDEAHNFHWSEDEVSEEYQIIKRISSGIKSLLLLSASPEQSADGYFGLLQLIDPHKYYDFEIFMREMAEYSQVGMIIEKFLKSLQINKDEEEMLKKEFEFPETFRESMVQIRLGNNQEKEKLIEIMREKHSQSKIVFRNSRKSLQGYPQRVIRSYPLEFSKYQVNNEGLDLSLKDPVIEWLTDFIQQNNSAKLLLICQKFEDSITIKKTLQSKISTNISLFHDKMSQKEQEINFRNFRENPEYKLLICSEIASEGRNFQFSNNLILFDLPLNPEILQQRIGRIDRIGQKSEINIHIPYIKNTRQEILFEIYHNGFNAFYSINTNIMKVFDKFSNRINYAIDNPDLYLDNPEILGSLTENIQNYIQELYLREQKSRDSLLELNTRNKDMGMKIKKEIRALEQDIDFELFMNNLFRYFGIEYQETDIRTYLLKTSDKSLRKLIAPLGMEISYLRNKALEKESIHFISHESPLTIKLIDKYLKEQKKLIN